MKPFKLSIIGLLFATSVSADVNELSQAELRDAIADNRAIPTRSLVAGVERFTGGEVLDIRAFLDGAEVVYRILYRGEDGAVDTILVNGGNGRAVSADSDVALAIAGYVGANPGNGNGNAFGLSNQNGVGNGRNNGNNGRGNDNRGGNGNGNGGGNGNGNGNGRNK